jgi:hypothetical protein
MPSRFANLRWMESSYVSVVDYIPLPEFGTQGVVATALSKAREAPADVHTPYDACCSQHANFTVAPDLRTVATSVACMYER